MPYTTDTEDRAFGGQFLGDIISYIADNFEPDEVYESSILKEWILDNGYVEDDNQ